VGFRCEVATSNARGYSDALNALGFELQTLLLLYDILHREVHVELKGAHLLDTNDSNQLDRSAGREPSRSGQVEKSAACQAEMREGERRRLVQLSKQEHCTVRSAADSLPSCLDTWKSLCCSSPRATLES